MTTKNHMAIYPAIFTPIDGRYLISFPDIPAINTIADTEEEAVLRAKEALELSLYLEKWPTPTKIQDVVVKPGEIIVMIYSDMRNVVGRYKRSRKQVTIADVYLTKMKERGLNISDTINQALQDRLDKN